jgi:hypothetical protein
MSRKRIPNPDRIRQVPDQFSWVDHCLVRHGHIRNKSAPALALYLFLVTVGDKAGVSYYGDERIRIELGLAGPDLSRARRELLDAQLIAFAPPYYQVLELPALEALREAQFATNLLGRRDAS